MAEPWYAVLGCTPWARDVFDTVLSKLPGEWRYFDKPRNWRERLGHPRYAFFLHWRWKVPDDVLAAVECVGLHAGDLPMERGGTPLQWRILDGQEVCVVTAFRMTAEVDAGPIYGRTTTSIAGPAELAYRSIMWTAAGIVRWITEIEPTPYRQQGTPKVFARRTPEQSNLARPGAESLEQLYDLIRCVDAPGYPLAYLRIPGFRFEFRRAVNYGGRIEADVTITRDESTAKLEPLL